MQAKRFFAESGKEKKRTFEITDTANAVFGGQVFAEMLAAICHEEHYRYSDQEVSPPKPTSMHIPRIVFSPSSLLPPPRPVGVNSFGWTCANPYG